MARPGRKNHVVRRAGEYPALLTRVYKDEKFSDHAPLIVDYS